MGISPRTIEVLRQQGHDVSHLLELGLYKLSDPEILWLAQEQERIVLTCDLDFSDLLSYSHSIRPSVILFRLRSFRPDYVNPRLLELLAQKAEELGTGAIAIVHDSGFRFRKLPLP